MRGSYSSTEYRYPHEQLILILTLGLALLVIALTATATLCGSALFLGGVIALAYVQTRSRHRSLLQGARRVTAQDLPRLAAAAAECQGRLGVASVDIFVAPGGALNAYTFGLTAPRAVVLYAGLLQAMDPDEIRFVLGHELGHVRLGHTWLNSLVGGLAGIPSPFLASAVLQVVFLWWNRACEYSADRAGLLACGMPSKAISALVKLAAGGRVRSRAEWDLAWQRIDAQDDDLANNLGEWLGTHPMIVKRIEQLRRYAASAEYRRLQALVAGNRPGPTGT